MKHIVRRMLFQLFAIVAIVSVHADTHYVDVNNSTPLAPYISWATAATSIQDAVDVAITGSTVLVTNGTYLVNSPISVTKNISIEGLNGPEVTIVDGQMTSGLFNLGGTACTLEGLTLTRSWGSGVAAIACSSRTPIITNCIIGNNRPYYEKVVNGGSIYNSIIENNWGLQAICSGSYISNSIVRNNRAVHEFGGYDIGTLNSCSTYDSIIWGSYETGVIYGDVHRSIITNNTKGIMHSSADNCLISGNNLGCKGSTVRNSVVVSNGTGIAVYVWFDISTIRYNSYTYNSIVYYNTEDFGPEYIEPIEGSAIHITANNCSPGLSGNGNITSPPLFVDQTVGNYRLTSGSPCINAGNNSYTNSLLDMDMNPRVIDGAVDMGAYEYSSYPILSSSAESLISLSVAQGSTPSARSFEVWNSGPSVMTYAISDDAAWLSTTPTNGTSTGEHDTIMINFDTASLSTGAYTGTITIESAGALESPKTTTVLLDVYTPGPEIESSHDMIVVPVLYGTRPANETFDLRSSITNNLINYSITDDQPWFSVSPTSGSSTGEADSLEISFYTEELPMGTHMGTITVTSPEADNSPKSIYVYANIHQTTLLCYTTDMSYRTVLSNSPPAQAIEVGSTLTGSTISYSITSDAGWLSTSPASGTSTGEFDEITVNINSSSLTEGTYVGHLTVSAPGSINSPHTITVELEVFRPVVYLDQQLEMNDWETPAGSDFAWTRNSGPTPSGDTGPAGAASGTYYMYTEASFENNPNKHAFLDKTFNFTGILEPELSFLYHMYGAGMGTLAVDVFTGTEWNWSIWYVSGQQHVNSNSAWSAAVVDLSVFGNQSNILVRFHGTTGSSYASDMAIDSVIIYNNALASYGSGDIDQDGIPDNWEEQYYDAVLNCDPNGNADGDAHNNKEEYIAWTDPTNAASYFAMTNYSLTHSNKVVAWPPVSGRVYSVLWTPSLTNSFQALQSDIPYPQNSYTDAVHQTEDNVFYKVDVSLEP